MLAGARRRDVYRALHQGVLGLPSKPTDAIVLAA
jgi:hypothetical protein